MTTCSYKFHPIGQGCFFTGIFKNPSHNQEVLNLVFDCCSLTAGSHLKDEITKFKEKIKKDNDGSAVIDLLMFSHFDEDHVNGILELLENVKCRTLVIPYLSIQERIAVFSREGTKAEWHMRFLRNPEQFICNSDYDVDRIILVDGNENFNNRVDFLDTSLDPDEKRFPNDRASSYFAQDNIRLDDNT